MKKIILLLVAIIISGLMIEVHGQNIPTKKQSDSTLNICIYKSVMELKKANVKMEYKQDSLSKRIIQKKTMMKK